MSIVNVNIKEQKTLPKKETTVSSFSITNETKESINKLSKNLRISKSEVINRAVSIFIKDDDALVESIMQGYKESTGKNISVEEINSRRINVK